MSDGRRPLTDPVADLLQDPVDAARVDRWWHEVTRRRLAARRRPPAGIALAVVLVSALGGYIAARLLPSDAPAPSSAPLALASGAPLTVEPIRAEGQQHSLRFEDGSSLRVEPGGVVTPVVNDGRDVVLLLDRGQIDLDLASTEGRRWSLECGLAQIDLIGARITVQRHAQQVTVSLVRGVALVRSARLPEGVRRVVAPDRIELTAPVPITPAQGVAPAAQETAVVAPPAPVRATATAASQRPPLSPPSGRDRASAEVATGSGSLSAVLKQVDRLRSEGDHDAAASLLREGLAAHPGDPLAALAGLSLGRVELERGQPVEGARAIEQALRDGLPLALQEDAMLQIAQAYETAGDRASSEIWRRTVRARFPQGSRLDPRDTPEGP